MILMDYLCKRYNYLPLFDMKGDNSNDISHFSYHGSLVSLSYKFNSCTIAVK
jgi:hypothetical protein